MTDQTTERQGDERTPDEDFLATARSRYDSGFQKEQSNIESAYEDLRFVAGGTAQWEDVAHQTRTAEGRPCLTINRLPQFCRQITGDIRQMKPAIRCLPVDDKADIKTAEVMQGVVRYIENRSKASSVYFKAVDSQVRAGVGAWRVTTDYASRNSFEQDIKITSIEDGIAVVWDPDSTEQSRNDAEFCFVPVDLSRAAFKAKYPDHTPSGWDRTTLAAFGDWLGDDHIRVAGYWYKEPVERVLFLTPDNQSIEL